jgi:PPOX class probable F420-dependent enzyme
MGVNQRADIVLSDEEIQTFLAGSRSMTLASVGPDGHPHLVAMWFALIDGQICFETKAKSQKAVNLRRNPLVSCLVEDGTVYEDLRGVAIEGTAEVTDDAELLWAIGVNVFERYYGPYTEDLKPIVETMLT